MPPEVEYASASRRLAADLGCAPCALGYPHQCMQGCMGHARGVADCAVCQVSVRSAAAYRRGGRRLVTPEQARRELGRRYVPPDPEMALRLLRRRYPEPWLLR